MEFDITSFRAVAENLPVGGAVCDLTHATLSAQTETDTEIAPLIEKVGATSIAEIDRLMAELQDCEQPTKHFRSHGGFDRGRHSGKVMTTVSRTPPNSVRRLLPLTRRQRTRGLTTTLAL
jgi:hypothetical protein